MAEGIIPAVAYYRMSDNDQDGSIEQQQAWAHDACPREGLEILAEFIDAGRPGHETAKRIDFHRMLDFCRQRFEQRRPIEAVVCWTTGRFSRSDSIETSWFIHEFRKAGVYRMYTAPGRWIDFRRMEDRILFGITQDASNHPYVQNLSMESLRGRLATAEAGDWCGGTAPLGYRVEVYAYVVGKKGKKKPRKKLVPDPETADVLRGLFRAYAEPDGSLFQLARQMNASGIPPRKGAKEWTPTVIRGILQNEVYLGDLIWNKVSGGKFFGVVDCRLSPRDGSGRRGKNEKKLRIRRPSRHEPLIDRELFDRVQVLLVERRRRTTPKAGGGDYVLTSLLRCGHCGRPMVGRRILFHQERRPVGAKVPGYICCTYNALGKAGCYHNGIAEGPLASAVARKLREALLNPETLAELREACKREAEQAGDSDAKEEGRLEGRLAELEKQVAAAARKFLLVEDERVSRECKKALDALTAERDRVEEALAKFRAHAPDRPDQDEIIDRAVELMHRFEEAIAGEPPQVRRAVLRSIIERVDLFFDHRTVGRRTFSTFVRGVVYVKEGILPSTWSLGSPKGTSQVGSWREIPFGAADLEAVR